MRKSLLPQTCSGLGLALLVAFGLLVVALPILAVRFFIAIAVDGIKFR